MTKIFGLLVLSTSLLTGCATLGTPAPSTTAQLAEITAVVTLSEAKACAENGGYGALVFTLNADGSPASELKGACVIKK